MSVDPLGGMLRFPISPVYDAAFVTSGESIAGEVYYVERNQSGGANLTPVARFFAWRPEFVEGFHEHWRVDCFVRIHKLSPEPSVLGVALAEGLLRENICSEPLWISWHRSEEVGGKEFGGVFDLA